MHVLLLQVVTERGHLARTLQAVRAVVPEVVAALQVGAPLRASSPPPGRGQQQQTRHWGISSPLRQQRLQEQEQDGGWTSCGPPASPSPPPGGRLYPLGLTHAPRASLLPAPQRRGLALFGNAHLAPAQQAAPELQHDQLLGQTIQVRSREGSPVREQLYLSEEDPAPASGEAILGGPRPPPPVSPVIRGPEAGLSARSSAVPRVQGALAGVHVAGTGAAAALAARSPSEAAWQTAQMSGPKLSVEARRVNAGPARAAAGEQK